MWEEEWPDPARTVGGGSYRRQYARGLWDGWATPTSGVLRLRVKVGSYIVVKKKTTEKVMATGRAHVLSGHDEVGCTDIPTEVGGVAKGTAASAAGESDFVGAFSREDLSSTDSRQELIFPANGRKKLQDKDSEHQPGSDVDGEDLAAQVLETEAATPSKNKTQKVYFTSENVTANHVSK